MEFQPSLKLAFLSMLLLYFAANNGMVSALSLCGMNNDDITACLPSVRGFIPPRPTPNCCRAVRKANLQCFCSYKHSVLIRQLGVNVDQLSTLMETPKRTANRAANPTTITATTGRKS
ncbi:putative lipid-transfer protein DIR1 [Carex littledalei]|uniref:Putative lipid-transfer protein DIR1 n=1 Tax=Carex littledalei TaxID=544730 RepID=A0A833VF65_9POAL|nr:putative lipid-transfer protein DIR1 [Carex littledalei]